MSQEAEDAAMNAEQEVQVTQSRNISVTCYQDGEGETVSVRLDLRCADCDMPYHATEKDTLTARETALNAGWSDESGRWKCEAHSTSGIRQYDPTTFKRIN